MLKRLQSNTYSKKILDCFLVADEIKNTAIELMKNLNIQPKVTIILPTNASEKARIDSANYVTKKHKVFEQISIPMQVIRKSPQYNKIHIKELIKDLSNDISNTGIIVQLPFPSGYFVNKNNILDTIPIYKDIDELTLGIKPATPLEICNIFDYYNIPTKGKHIVIMVKDQLVGQPLACMLMGPPYNATVTTCDIHTENIDKITKNADILIIAIGKALYVNEDLVKPDAIVIDASINKIPSNFTNGTAKVVGDVNHSVYEKCQYYTPVPGGVGLLTVSSLAFNAINASIL
ncbi:17918_t:CDS:2 [Cetraspora pellucida]|uniref:17918_t:CDS:1 n=1 Tax=Cetraspora pellucida TaxID=1433469 RepID=A0ACA9Q053_9GLOM|nr:17918_t:CDS:2 [Cetraspora pellucida]